MGIDIKGYLKRIKPGHYLYTNLAQDVYIIERENKSDELYWRVTHDHGPWIGAITYPDYFKTLDEVKDYLEDEYYNVYIKVEKKSKTKTKKKKNGKSSNRTTKRTPRRISEK